MSEYERSLVVEAAPETVFDFITDPRCVSILIPPASRAGASASGGSAAEEGWMRVHPGEYLLEWGSDGARFYSGWLQVEELGDEAAEITLHLSFPSQMDLSAAAIELDLLLAMQAIKEQVERSALGSKTRDF